MNYPLSWHLKKNVQLAAPVMMGQLGQVMVGVADTIMVGQVGKIPLAASSLANSLFIIIMVFGIGVSFAISPITAKAQGENNYHSTSNILKHSLVVNTSLGVILSSLVILLSYSIPYLNQPEDVATLAAPYLRIIGISILPIMVFQALRQFSEGLSITIPPMIIIIGTNLLNILFNYILIFGKLGFPAMGLFGAGIATLLSRIIMMSIIYVYIFSSNKFNPYLKYFKEVIISMVEVKKILKLGLPMGLQFTFEVTAFAFAAIMIGWLGATELAAHQIAINLAAVTFMAASGIGAAASIRVGNQLGKKDIVTMRNAAFTCVGMVGVFMLVMAAGFILLRNYLPHLYINNEDVIAQAASLLVVAAIFQLSDGLQVVSLGALRGIADVKIPTFITLFAYWGCALPFGYILGFKFGLGAEGVWYGLLIGLTIAAILLLLRFNKESARMLQKFPLAQRVKLPVN